MSVVPVTNVPVAPLDLEDASAEEILRYAVEQYHPQLYLACSFQKEESVILDMLMKIEPSARVFALDTSVLFPETYANWTELERRYDTKIESFQGISLGHQAAQYGDELWKSDPTQCCNLRKVTPLREALAQVDAWITGIRREQSPTRANAAKFGFDETFGLWKFNPLADWTDKQVWNYIAKHDLPYNKLHDQDYSSIGCTHCTLPGQGREGRWAGADKTECGLHQ